ncbi:aspartyl/asparaginyl beta-hydroxylase domain-containing protein [Collimonas humicola]|uniref:aspartyl/asparaginyl beta-hydroxylase domain-containing protein n=1 Tax=Collimonas humicola TaxID=2825886 RepID=UPI001B8D252F|nr:aspartyl/asparaginyl beta-hydroxylase domain-containing protein [Collimonas humicola]
MFHAPSDFGFIKIFESHWQEIRDDYRSLEKKMIDVHRNGGHEDYLNQVIGNNGWAPSWSVGSSDKNFNWLTYGLCYRGVFPADAAEKFPFTMDLLRNTPGIHACAFSQTLPGSYIAPHLHSELGGDLLTYHLGLEMEPRCSYLCVGDIFEDEAEGKSIVFDGSVEHFAMNASQLCRTILYLEFDKSKIAQYGR